MTVRAACGKSPDKLLIARLTPSASRKLSTMTSSPTPATHRVSFAISDEQAARRVVDVLTEVFFEGEAAVAAFERPDGRWDVTVHFAEAPDQALVRELVTN